MLEMDMYDDVSDAILKAVGYPVPEDLHKKLSKVVQRLTSEWCRTWENGYDYLMELLVLVGRFDLPVSPILVKYLVSGILKGKISKWGDLHLFALKAMLPYYHYDEMLRPVLVGDLKEPIYSTVCFKGLYRMHPGNAATYLPDIMKLAIQCPNQVLAGAILFDLGATLRPCGLVEVLRDTWPGMYPDEQSLVLDSLAGNPHIQILRPPGLPNYAEYDLLITVPGAGRQDPYFCVHDPRRELGLENELHLPEWRTYLKEIQEAQPVFAGNA